MSFSLLLVVSNLIMMCLGVILLIFVWVMLNFLNCGFMVFTKFGKLSTIITPNIFSVLCYSGIPLLTECSQSYLKWLPRASISDPKLSSGLLPYYLIYPMLQSKVLLIHLCSSPRPLLTGNHLCPFPTDLGLKIQFALHGWTQSCLLHKTFPNRDRMMFFFCILTGLCVIVFPWGPEDFLFIILGWTHLQTQKKGIGPCCPCDGNKS